MDFIHLSLQLPRLSGEQAHAMQQTLYAFLDAFDSLYCHAIEQYLKDESNQRHINNLQLQELIQTLGSDEPPF